MARVINEKEHQQRRSEILDSAQRFIYSKGYEQMSIQDILDDLKISKGAFYHYFGSKQDLLEGMIERLSSPVIEVVKPIVDDPTIDAVEKLHRYFETGARWKSDKKAFLIGLFRVWYLDDNLIVRQKVTASSLKFIAPMINKIIRQGIDEGLFHTDYPDQMGEVVMTLLEGMGDAMAMLILSAEPGMDARKQLVKIAQVYTVSLERVLGLKEGRLQLMDMEDLKGWIMEPVSQMAETSIEAQ